MKTVPLLRLLAIASLISLGLVPILNASDSLVSIATYSAEWLGKPDRSPSWDGGREEQLRLAAREIRDLDADIVALQEVVIDEVNGDALTDLLSILNALGGADTWRGVASSRFSNWWEPATESEPAARLAYIWREGKVEGVDALPILRWIPQDDPRFDYGNLPFFLQARVRAGDRKQSLLLFNLQLGTESAGQRQDSMEALLSDLRSQFQNDPLILLGDFNVADRGGANGEIAEWGIYDDADGDGAADFFHVAGAVEDEDWDDIDHILFSDELGSLYQAAPVESRNLRIPSLVSDHDPIMIRLSWEPTPEVLDAIWKRDNPGEYVLVLSDEFEQPDGSFPDRANWVHEIGGGGWGNEEEQYYTSSTDNVRIENGHLVLELREDSANQYPENDYTSGRIRTKDRQAWTHGRMEARIRLPYGLGSGLWPGRLERFDALLHFHPQQRGCECRVPSQFRSGHQRRDRPC